MAGPLVVAACGKIAAAPSEPDPEPAPSPQRDAAPTPIDVGSEASAPVEAAAPVSLADYNQSCTINADCALTLPAPCPDGSCWCNDTPINRADYGRYSQALLAEATASGCETLPLNRCSGKCLDLIALCVSERCVALPRPSAPSLDGYDQSCGSVDDCVAVRPDPCFCQACASGAIARSELARYEADQAALPTCGTRGSCDPAPTCFYESLRCEEGHCEYAVTSGPP